MREQVTIEDFMRRADYRVAVRNLRARRRELGLCQCGSAPLPGRRRCDRCKIADDVSNAMRSKRG
jgi:hypothetical protein